jgi:methylosome protein 50
MFQYQTPRAMDRQLDVLRCHADGGLLLGASCLTGRYWLGSLWFYQTPETAPNADKWTAGVQLEAGICDAEWVDTTHVVVGLDTGGIALWKLEDDYRTFVLSQAAAGHDGLVTRVSVVCDKTKAVSGSHDRCIKLWDLSNTSLIYVAQAHSDLVSCVDCHPSEPEMFVSCGQDGRILVWDKRKPKHASILNKTPLLHTPTCVKWQPGGVHKMAVGSESGQIAILDTRMGVDNYLTSNPHTRSVYSLQFCATRPSLLASISEDCTTVVTTVDEDGLIEAYRDITHQDFVHGLAWSSESQLYTCGWDARVLSHNLTSRTATVMGDPAHERIQINGNVDDLHKTGFEAGDVPEKMCAAKTDQCKPTYSQVVQVKSEISAEG